jgi:hypothetical protein
MPLVCQAIRVGRTDHLCVRHKYPKPMAFRLNPDIPSTLHSTMSNDGDPSVTVYQHYCPRGVKRVLASGSSAFIGEVDDPTVFKYPLAPGGEMSRLEVEGKLLQIVGQHERIIGLNGISETGLYFERAENGTAADYILTLDRTLLLKQRLTWCREITEAVATNSSGMQLQCRHRIDAPTPPWLAELA